MDYYDDIINLPHYEPKHHPRMTMWNRAAQFAPFAALTGYDAAYQRVIEMTDGHKIPIDFIKGITIKEHAL